MQSKDKSDKKSVTTPENASKRFDLELSIDKLTYRFDYMLDMKSVIEHLNGRKKTYQQSRLKREHVIKVGNFYFSFLLNNRNYISSLITNPSDFESFQLYEKELKSICGDLVDQLIPSRLDIAIDIFDESFEWLNSRISIPRKRAIDRHVIDGCKEQTRYFGKKPNEIVFYDREEKDEEEKGCRIEARLYQPKNIGAKTYRELIDRLVAPDFNPFHKIELIDFKVTNFPHEKKFIRRLLVRERLKTLIKYNGFFYARKVLNQNRNFKRLSDKYFNILQTYSFGDCYHTLIGDYLANGGCHE